MQNRQRNTQNSCLKILNPVIWVSKFLGVSPLWIHKDDGHETISVSSSFTVFYSSFFCSYGDFASTSSERV